MNTPDSHIKELYVRVKFFAPYRIMEWVDKKNRSNHRRFQRFLTYLNWHMPQSEKNGQKPYIRGTLIRSVTIRKLEEMFALFYKQFTDICPGEAMFRDNGKSKRSDFIRHRERYVFGDKVPCDHGDKKNACLFCQILGVCDNPGTEYDPKESKKSVRFANFKTDKTFNNIDELTHLRTKNRYDKDSRKAKDYFRVREADYHACSEFTGSIEINTELVNDIGGVECLLSAGLARINYLAGAPCRIDIGVEDNGTWNFTEHQDLLNSFKKRFFKLSESKDEKKDRPDDRDDLSSPPAKTDMTIPINKAKDAAGSIIEIVKKTNSQVHLRRLADAIRELRRKPVGELESLPEIKRETGKPSLWGLKVSSGSQSILTTIKKKVLNLSEQKYRSFFESLGECLYEEAKKEKIIRPSPGRILGENEYYGRPSEEDPGDQPLGADTLSPNMCEWIITGYLKAKSPFFFGIGSSTEQTDLQVLTDANGNLRLSYDLLRGVLRRDLETVLSGRNMEIGTSRPCDCPVCELISRCKFQDSLAHDYQLPPETRQRIKIRPHTGTVEKGGLFNMEVGPEGLRFPFILRFRSNSSKIDEPLLNILGLWADGQCALGGNIGTGKGIFKLIEEKFFKISFESRHKKPPRENFYQLLQNRGFIGLEKEELEQALLTAGYSNEGDAITLIPPEKAAFTKVTYDIYLKCPVLTNDPVAAMFEQDTPDAAMFKKSRVVYNKEGRFDKIREVYCLKAEGFRGHLRYLIGKEEDLHDLPHEDCDCFMCRIFGNNQIGGHIRFDDLELAEDRKAMRCDHVAIDWNGGGKEHAKYDDYPLAGSPKHELKFKGAFWVSNRLDEDSKKAIRDALVDLQDGMTTIGAKGSIGYGWVSRIEFHKGAPDWIRNFPGPVQEILSENTPESKGDGDNDIMLSPDCKYNPYYYLQPDSRIKRFDDLITHERYHEDKLSGKITCDLETLSSLFIPDTTNDRALDINVDPEHTKLVAGFTTKEHASFLEKYPNVGDILGSIKPDEKGMIRLPLSKIKPEDISRIGNEAYSEIVKHTPHKSHRFFRINEEVMLPGSGPRGMIASVYQMLTNSCFRNMDETLYLSRRMAAEEGGKIKRGVVTRDEEGNYFILEAQSYRLPLYDDVGTTAKIKGPKTNDIIATHAKKNKDYLEKLFGKDEFKRNRILEGRESVKFNPLTKKDGWTNGADKIAVLHKTGSHSGFIKFTGFNAGTKANQMDVSITYQKLDEKWDPWHLNILLNSKHSVARKGGERPTLCCEAGAYYIMIKRAERVFDITVKDYKSKELMDLGSKDGVFRISSRAKKQYEDILEAYGHNTGKIVGNFRTQIINDRLTDGDLMYFKPEGIYAENIIPVCISRKTDRLPLGKKFLDGYKDLRPCDGECLEDCETCYPECLSEYISRLPFELCPTCSLFGTTSFRGRVRFGFARLLSNDEAGNENKAKWYSNGDGYIEGDNGKPITIKLLERPRATWPIRDGNATIPGRKIYVNHPDGVEIDSVEPTENNTTIEPLAAGNRFRFQIVFENLTKSELGNLIYSIELEPGMANRLGRGKPLGMGSVKIDVKDILIRKSLGIWGNGLDKQDYIDAGKTELAKWFGASNWDEIKHIQDLRQLLRIPTGNHGLICYPGLEEHKALKKKWLSISEFQARLITPWEAWNLEELSVAAQKNAKKLEKLLRVEEAGANAFHPVSGQKAEVIHDKHMKDSKNFTGERYGTVKWFNDKIRYGFIEQEDGPDVFVHRSGIAASGFKTLDENDKVKFDIEQGEKGPNAINVEKIT